MVLRAAHGGTAFAATIMFLMDSKPHIQIIQGSTRHGTNAPKVASWFLALGQKHDDCTLELVNLLEWNLPFFDDPSSPSTGEYHTEAAKRWSAQIAKADGYVIITPEYNHGYPAGLKNALDLIYREWNRKPVAFVSYSTGAIGGARSVEQLRQVVIDLQMVPIHSALHIPAIETAFDEHGQLDPSWAKRADVLLTELRWWAIVLREGRERHPIVKK